MIFAGTSRIVAGVLRIVARLCKFLEDYSCTSSRIPLKFLMQIFKDFHRGSSVKKDGLR